MKFNNTHGMLAAAVTAALCGVSTSAFAAPSLSQPGVELFDKLPGAEADVDDEQLYPPVAQQPTTKQPATGEQTQPSDASQTPAEGTAPSDASQPGGETQQPAEQPTLFSIDAIKLDAAELDLSQKELADIDAIFSEELHHELTLQELNQTIAKVTPFS